MWLLWRHPCRIFNKSPLKTTNGRKTTTGGGGESPPVFPKKENTAAPTGARVLGATHMAQLSKASRPTQFTRMAKTAKTTMPRLRRTPAWRWTLFPGPGERGKKGVRGEGGGGAPGKGLTFASFLGGSKSKRMTRSSRFERCSNKGTNFFRFCLF